jgi:hypothetical protein
MTEGDALSAYVAGRISFAALRNAVARSTEFVFEPNGTVHVTCRRPLPRTAIRPKDLQRALTRYQNGNTTIEELSIWALVLHNLDAFDMQGPSEQVKEQLWDVLGQLSLASVNDAFDASRVSGLLEQVRSLALDREGGHHSDLGDEPR